MSKNIANKILFPIYMFAIVSLLVSCSVKDISIPLTFEPTLTSMPSPMVPQAIVDLTIAPSQQSLVDPVDNRCAKSVPLEQLVIDANNVLLMYSKDNNIPYLSNPINNNKKELRFEPNVTPFDIILSPNRKLIAMTMLTTIPRAETTKLLIVDAGGVILKDIVWKREWGRIAAWLDDHHLLIAKQADLQLSIYNPKTVILLDINTGEDIEIQATYPDLNQVEYVNWNIINYVFSPDLTRVLYPTSKVDPGYVNYVALLDMENKQVLAILPVVLTETSLPQWSPDGSQILVSGLAFTPGEGSTAWRGQELYTIDANGKITQLTHFTSYYSGTVTIEKYTWAPDGKSIAFWIQTEQMDKPQLATLNIITGEVINHCISARPFHAAYRPIWSPLGDYLMIVQQESINADSQTFLMNIVHNTITQMEENITPVGWMFSQ